MYGQGVRVACLALLVAAGVSAASKQETEQLRRSLAVAQAQIAQAAKEKAALQDALKSSASAQAQLAAALRDKAHVQALLEASDVRNRATQETAVRAAAQQAAAQTAQVANRAAADLAAKNHADLSKALAQVSATERQRAAVAERHSAEAAEAVRANTEVQQSFITQQDLVNEETKRRQEWDKLQLQEIREQGSRNVTLMKLGTLGSFISLLTIMVKFAWDERRHRWRTAVTVSAIATTTRATIREELQQQAPAAPVSHGDLAD